MYDDVNLLIIKGMQNGYSHKAKQNQIVPEVSKL